MSQEATMIAVDDSDFMRNGDFAPSRLQSQNDAVGLVCQSKHRKNPENTIGLISLANTDVLCTLTSEVTKVHSRLHTVEPKGNIKFCTALKIAHLALRHRQLRHQKMRIVCFIGSPVTDEEPAMVQLAKRLKKENVSVDLINFGENELNQQKLSSFIDILSGDGSHLVSVPPGAVLQDSLITSPIIAGEYGGTMATPGLGLDFGLDGSEDPDLLFALRVSMEDQRMRQEQEMAASGTADSNAASLPVGQGSSEDAMLQQALRLSMQMEGVNEVVTPRPMDVDFDAMSEEDQIALALVMSMQQPNEPSSSDAAKQTEQPLDSSATAMEVEKPAETSGAGPTELEVIKNVLDELPTEEMPEGSSSKKKEEEEEKKK